MSRPLAALHGFTLTGAMFGELRPLLGREVVAPDLPGHGAASAGAATPEATVTVAARALEAAGPPADLLGYSLGGRVALLAALERPELVRRLVVVSASAGIAGAGERADRREADEALAQRIEQEGVAAFVDGWLAAPMFAGLAARGEEWRAADREARLGNTAPGLAAALRGLGQGTFPYLGDRVGELAVPLLAVAGGRDAKYAAAARALAVAVPDGRVAVVPDAGHAVVGEAPAELAAAVGGFLAG